MHAFNVTSLNVRSAFKWIICGCWQLIVWCTKNLFPVNCLQRCFTGFVSLRLWLWHWQQPVKQSMLLVDLLHYPAKKTKTVELSWAAVRIHCTKSLDWLAKRVNFALCPQGKLACLVVKIFFRLWRNNISIVAPGLHRFAKGWKIPRKFMVNVHGKASWGILETFPGNVWELEFLEIERDQCEQLHRTKTWTWS